MASELVLRRGSEWLAGATIDRRHGPLEVPAVRWSEELDQAVRFGQHNRRELAAELAHVLGADVALLDDELALEQQRRITTSALHRTDTADRLIECGARQARGDCAADPLVQRCRECPVDDGARELELAAEAP